ncbi:MAG: hypothetical protein U0169_12630 [Polyangiaceae bacterium]
MTIELTSVWFAGAGNLYNREFYAIAKARLAESGILQQWVQLHHTTEDVIASQMATVRSEFAHVRFFSRGDQGFLVASERPLVVDDARLRALEVRPALRETLGDAASLREYGESQVFDERQLDAFVDAVARRRGVSRDALVSTDDNLRIEYDTPRNNVPGMPAIDATLRALEASKSAR